MGKYLHKFENQAAFEAAYNGPDYIEPWVSYTENVGLNFNMTEEQKEAKYLQMPFTIEALASGDVTWTSLYTYNTAEYSVDGGETWETMDGNTVIPVVAGDEVQIKMGTWSSVYTPVGTIKSTGNFNVKGNIMSLTHGDNFENADTIINPIDRVFQNVTTLISAEHLKLPATHVSTTIGGYQQMFQGCTNLIKAPKEISLIETTGSTNGYVCQNMFNGCTSLTKAPKIKATAVGPFGFHQMFYGCTALVDVQSTLPATSLDNMSYSGMFQGCTSLESAPEICATTLSNGSCCSAMFYGCTNLTKAPSILPAMNLVSGCYLNMFQGCTSLTTAPELPALTLVGSCYNAMFKGCTNLNYIKAAFTSLIGINSPNNTDQWVDGVAAEGTFVMNPNAEWYDIRDRGDIRNKYGVPADWTIETI